MKTDNSHEPRCKKNTMKACIPDSAPYLSHPLKMDNLPQICKHVSEYVLHGLMTTSASVILQI